MAETLIEVGRFADPVEAALLRNRLVAVGTKAVLADAETVPINCLWSDPMGGVKVLVPESEVERSADVLDENTVLESLPEELPEEGEEEPGAAAAPPELTRREKDGEIAFYVAWAGVVLFPVLIPLQVYSCWLLVRVFFADERLEGEARRFAWMATGINVTLFVLPIAILACVLFNSLS